MIDSKPTPYELTPEQIRDGWTRRQGQVALSYHNPSGFSCDPAPGIPALQIWWRDGTRKEVSYYRNGLAHDSTPGQAAREEWWSNGAKRSEQHWTSGNFIYQIIWLEDGRQVDLIPS